MPRIIKNFAAQFNTIKSANAAKNSTGKTVDTLANILAVLGKNAGNIPVEGGMLVPVPEGDKNGQKTLMTIRARLVSVTREGQPWAGRAFSLTKSIDPETNKMDIAVFRDKDLETPLPAKTGGRTKGSKNAPKAGAEASTPNAEAHGNATGKDALAAKMQGDAGTTVKDLTA